MIGNKTFLDVAPPLEPDPGLDPDEDSVTPLHIPAMKEKAYMRLTYLQVVLGNVFGKLTWDHATELLCTTLNILLMAGSLLLFPKPVTTLQSACVQLGIDPDAHIIQYSICPQCWKHYTPAKTKDLESADCTMLRCTGKLFTINKGNRIPILINHQVCIIGSLRHMFL